MPITIQKLDYTEDVYDIQVAENRNFFADSILVHNCEIDLPTKPLNGLNDDNGEIALCTLAAINFGNIKTPEDFEKPADLLVRALDELLDYQDYPILAAEKSTLNRRPLGIGIINFAYWLAKNDMTYSNPDLEKVDEYAQAFSYYITKSSIDLAEEKGPCNYVEDTEYNSGTLPVDLRKPQVDELLAHKDKMPWNKLRERLRKTGIRNSTLMALMPSETSSQISNATNGIEPPRALVSVKQSKHGSLKQVVPGIHSLKNKYEFLFGQNVHDGYMKIVAILQKYIDQGISVNTSYNPRSHPNNKVPLSVLLKDLLDFYKYGGKQLYYHQTKDHQSDEIEEDCESCKI